MQDDDSTYGPSEVSTSTSLRSSVMEFQYENGRRYHAFKSGAYTMPNDEAEQDRLDLLHHIWRLVMGGALYRSPVREPQNILDLGTGTGIWPV